MATPDFTNLFTSASLTYRALENTPEDRAFLHNSIHSDPKSHALSTIRLLKPLTQDEVAQSLKTMTSALLAVMICLPPPKSEMSDLDRPPPPSLNGLPIGTLILTTPPKAHQHRSCTLGISIVSEYQGKGYGTEAIMWSLDWAFAVAGMHVVRLGCFSFNEAAIRIYERIGFKKDGVKRHTYFYGGRWWDDVCYSMLDEEWKDLMSEQANEIKASQGYNYLLR